MSDFFSKLGDHLDDAARREADRDAAPRGGRAGAALSALLRGPAPRAFAAVAVVLAVVALGAYALPRIAGDDTEQAASDPDAGWTSYVPDCDDHSTTLPSEGGPFPEPLRSRFSVFAEESKAEQVRPPIEGFSGLPVSGVQTKEARLVTERDGVEVYIVPVSHVDDERQCATKPGDASTEQQAKAALPDKLSPGVCVLLQAESKYASACWSLKTIDAGRSVLGPKPFDLLAAAVPDGHPTVEIGTVGSDNSFASGGTSDVIGNVGLVAEPERGDGATQWRDAGLTPVDKTYSPPDYGCDGPVHPETLEAYNVLRNDPDLEGFEALKEPEGITFLSEPRLARESFGAKFWLVAAAAPPDCSKPVICVATDFGADVVECAPVKAAESTPVITRLEPGGDPTLVIFAAVPDHTPPLTIERRGIDPIQLGIEGNIAAAGGKFVEERARQIAEAVGGAPIKITAESGATADHNDR